MTSETHALSQRKKGKTWKSFKIVLRRDYQLYLLVIPSIIYFLVFHYAPMYGIQIAFKDFSPTLGITGSPWAGLKHFERFFSSHQFWRLIKNTLGVSLYQLIAGFPIPIMLALLINQVKQKHFKKLVQTVTYIPHFISIVVLVGMINVFLSPTSGLVNHVLQLFGREPVYFLGEPNFFKSIFVWSGVWQSAGWGSIIYLAALSGVNPELYEAAKVDGASKFQTIRNIDLPSIMPTIIVLLIMNLGRIMNVGFQKAYLLQNPLNAGASEVIQTYMYKIGLIGMQFEYSTAISLFNTLINVILLVTANQLSKKFTENSLW